MTIKSDFDLGLCFQQLRFDPNHHLGLGDIRLTLAQQEEIVALIEQKLNKHGVMQAEVSDGAKGAAVGQRSVGTVAEGPEIVNVKTGQLVIVDEYGFMFGKDNSTGQIICFNINYVRGTP